MAPKGERAMLLGGGGDGLGGGTRQGDPDLGKQGGGSEQLLCRHARMLTTRGGGGGDGRQDGGVEGGSDRLLEYRLAGSWALTGKMPYTTTTT